MNLQIKEAQTNPKHKEHKENYIKPQHPQKLKHSHKEENPTNRKRHIKL